VSDAKKQNKPMSRLKTALTVLLGSRKRAEEARTDAESIKVMYGHFREILILNDAVLEVIADIEDRLTGRRVFSFNAMARRIRQGVMNTFSMTRSLDQLTSGRYVELYDALRRIGQRLDAELAPVAEEPLVGPLVIPLSGVRASDANLVGSKMANLGEIKNVLSLSVPDGFAITTFAFDRFMAHGELVERGERLEDVLEVYGDRGAMEPCRQVQKEIMDAPMPPELEDAIFRAFDDLAGGQDMLVAMRSSALGEDRATSHAGLYYTELNVGRDWLLDAYRWVLASAYGINPVVYRLKHGLLSTEAHMAAGCLRMVPARCSGVMFSRSFEDPAADRVVISAAAGMAEAVTGGRAVTENLVISPDVTKVNSVLLSREDIEDLVYAARLLESHFGGPQDVEWAIDESGRVFILQSRPTEPIRTPTETDDPAYVPQGEPILSGGYIACPGIGGGAVFQVRGGDDLGRVPDRTVLVARHSSPSLAQVMGRCSAIVTEEGSPIGHMAILAREFGVPAIVGLRGAMEKLENGRKVTVDAMTLRIYEGAGIEGIQRVGKTTQLADSPAVQRLRRIADLIVPLWLVDTASPQFAPVHCRTLHDIIRLVHEKVFEAMFYLGDRAALTRPNACRLGGRLPYDIFVLDVGAGLAENLDPARELTEADILSMPLKAFIEGLLDSRIRWDRPRAVSARGFFSVLGENIAGPPAEARGVGKVSFAIVSDRYLNFSTKAGYHFNTVDTYCGKSLNKNYIHWRFEGGAATEVRRARRCRFLSIILETLDFKTQVRGDVLVARLEKYNRDIIKARLKTLGQLTLCARQLDMLMDTDDSPEFFARAFLAGELDRF